MKRLTHMRLPVVLAMTFLAGCSSSPPQTFHALTRYASDAAPSAVATRSYGVVVGPVSVPEAVDRPQMVILAAPGRFDIKEQQRWAGPLSADIAQALAENLSQALPQAYVYSQASSPAHSVPPRFRVAVDVQRFESRLQGNAAGAVIEAAWVVTDTRDGRKQVCRSLAQKPLAGNGYDALVVAHQFALVSLSEHMAAVVAQLAVGQADFSVPLGTYCQR